jgi:dienelactone hydrolase
LYPAQAWISVPSALKCLPDTQSLFSAISSTSLKKATAASWAIRRWRFLHCRHPRRVVRRQPNEPAEQQVVLRLLHELALRAHAEQDLQQHRAQQLLRRDARAADLDAGLVHPREQLVHLGQRLVAVELSQVAGSAALAQLEARGVCDGRIAISGKSYRGYLSGFATGNSDRFSAAVVMAPVGNIETHYGTSDGGYYADPFYMASKPGFDRQLAAKLSPLQHIEKSATPTLFLQGKDDERCPKCQSEELFVSLARAGDTPAELVLYPGETHGFIGAGAPSCREDAAERIVDWLTRHTLSSRPAPVRQGGVKVSA